MGSDSAQDLAVPAVDESTLSPDTSFHPSSMVTRLVGPEEQEMTVHGDRLVRNSAYSRAALREEWLEDQTRVIKLVDESTEIMRHYIEYVYSGKPPTHDLTVAPEARSIVSRHYPLLAEIYIIAERGLDAKCQNVIIRELIRLVKLTQKSPGVACVDIVYRGTTAESPARRLVVDFATGCINDYWLLIEGTGLHEEFWRDLSKALLRKAKTPIDPIKAKNYLVREDT